MESISNNINGSDKNQTNPSTTTADGNTISTKQPKEKQAETKAVPTPTGPPPNQRKKTHSVKITKTGTTQLVDESLKKGKKGKRVRKKNLTTDQRKAYEAEKQKKADALDTERKKRKTTILICG